MDDVVVKKELEEEPSKRTVSRRQAIMRIAGTLAAVAGGSKLASATSKLAEGMPWPNNNSYFNYAQYTEIYGSYWSTGYSDFYANYANYYHSTTYVPPP